MPKDTIFYNSSSLRIQGRLLSLDQPLIMGILNLTPDSFIENSRIKDAELLLEKAGKMIKEGADILDLGGYSTRPGAAEISEKEEMKRLIPAIKLLHEHYPDILISADTFRGNVALKAVESGASIINDISGYSFDSRMKEVIQETKQPYILMHMPGNLQSMHEKPHYKNITSEIIKWFSEKVEELKMLGVNDIILDPGFGFGKSTEENFQLLNELDHFRIFGIPVLAGISRKSFIYKTLRTTAAEALNGTTALHMLALLKGANILRVHDVREAKEVLILKNQITGNM